MVAPNGTHLSNLRVELNVYSDHFSSTRNSQLELDVSNETQNYLFATGIDTQQHHSVDTWHRVQRASTLVCLPMDAVYVREIQIACEIMRERVKRTK